MTPKFPAVTAKELARVAERLGFRLRRQTGSHAVYVRADDRARVVIPMHGGERSGSRNAIQSARYHVAVGSESVAGVNPGLADKGI